jgi:hypothetical protein
MTPARLSSAVVELAGGLLRPGIVTARRFVLIAMGREPHGERVEFALFWPICASSPQPPANRKRRGLEVKLYGSANATRTQDRLVYGPRLQSFGLSSRRESGERKCGRPAQ